MSVERQTSDQRSRALLRHCTAHLALAFAANWGLAHPQQGATGIEAKTAPQRTDVLGPLVDPPGNGELEIHLPSRQPGYLRGNLSSGEPIEVSRVKVVGRRALPAEQLAAIAKSYEGRALTAFEIVTLRDLITEAYVAAGFINSGAVIREQEVVDGVLVIDVVEGRLDVRIEDLGGRLHGLNPDYVRARIWPDRNAILQRSELEENFKLLASDPNIRNIEASLHPTSERGLAVLDVRVEAQDPLRITAGLATERSPSVGGLRASIGVEARNLLGWGDTYSLSVGKTEGLFDAIGSVNHSLTPDIEVVLRGSYSDAKVIEEPLNALDIVSEAASASIGLEYAWMRTSGVAAVLGAEIDRRRSDTGLLDQPFSFSPGAIDGVTETTIARVSQSLSLRAPDHFLGARATISLGLDALDHPSPDAFTPPKNFTSVLVQAQYAMRLPDGYSQFSARADLQYTDDPLVAMEQFAFGGIDSVRGYRANQVLGDRGAVASVEYSYALGRKMEWYDSPFGNLSVSVFLDAGYAENVRAPFAGENTLVGVGAAVSVPIADGIELSYYAAISLTDVSQAATDSLQDKEMGFRLTARLW